MSAETPSSYPPPSGHAYPPPGDPPAAAPPPAAPPAGAPPVDNAQDGQDWLEIIAATMLGLAAIAIAWSAYQSSLWGGQQDAALTESVRANGVATDLFQNADTVKNFDQTLFIQVLTTGVCDEETAQADEFVCDQIFANMSDFGLDAVVEWETNDALVPFETDAYNDALYAPGEDAVASSDQFFAEAAVANENGDDYELASTMLATVLFFAGISIVVGWVAIRRLLLAAAGALLLGAVGYMSTLPLA